MKAYSFSFIFIIISSVVIADESDNLLQNVLDTKSWVLQQVSPASGTVKVTKNEIQLNVLLSDGIDWHFQIYQANLDLEENSTYTLKFKVRSPEQRGYTIRAMVDVKNYHEIGLHKELFASKHFREESFTFRARRVAPGKNRVGFVLGDSRGSLIIKDISLTKE